MSRRFAPAFAALCGVALAIAFDLSSACAWAASLRACTFAFVTGWIAVALGLRGPWGERILVALGVVTTLGVAFGIALGFA